MLFCEHQFISQADSPWDNRHLKPSCLQGHAQHRSVPTAQGPGSHLRPVTARSAQLCQLLTALRTITILCAVGDLLLADAVLVCFAISAWASANAGFETPAAQDLPTGKRGERGNVSSDAGQQHPLASHQIVHKQTQTPHFPVRITQVLGNSDLQRFQNILWPLASNCP